MNRAEAWQQPGPLALLRGWARDGVPRQEIARRMGLSPRRLDLWCRRHPKLGEALALGREMVDYQVEEALLRAALGYRCREERTEQTDRGEKLVVTEKEVTPNVSAISLWLRRRRPDLWGEGEEGAQTGAENNLFAALGNWQEEVLEGDAVPGLQPTAEADPDLVEAP